MSPEPAGDQVGVDNEFGKRPQPWEKPFGRLRLREMGYSLLSWPYIIAFAITIRFLVRPDPLVLQAMIAAWTLAFARREWANWLAARKGP